MLLPPIRVVCFPLKFCVLTVDIHVVVLAGCDTTILRCDVVSFVLFVVCLLTMVNIDVVVAESMRPTGCDKDFFKFGV